MSLILQIFKDKPGLNSFVEPALDKVIERLRNTGFEPMLPSLKKHLLQVFLSSLYFEPNATLNFMKQRNILKEVLVEIFKLKQNFKEPFE